MTNKKVQIGDLTLINSDCLTVLKTLPDNCIDLIVTDPPYYRVKANAWDNQWDSVEHFLAWLDDIFAEFWRVLKPTGSLYCFCGPRLASATELLMEQRFNILNHIVWAKPNGRWNGCKKESLRSYFPANERILFSEHYGAEGKAKSQSGYYIKCAELKAQVFEPLIEYFRTAREQLGVSASQINEATGTQMCSHWFSKSQWQLPSEKQYKALQNLFKRVAEDKGLKIGLEDDHSALTQQYGVLLNDYVGLVAEYDELKAQYESLRRPFMVTKDVPYTDIWTYKPVPYYKGKHPCEKPLDMMIDIISASSREGDTIGDFFFGSGASLQAAKLLKRKAIGTELEEETFLKAVKLLSK